MSPISGFRRILLATILGLGVWAGLARADGRRPKYPAGYTLAPPGVVVDQNGRRPCGNWLRRKCNLKCWASFNNPGCGSLRSEIAFIFGSCRNFFGEPCLAGPPPSPLPPWLNLGTPGTSDGPPAFDPWGPDSPWAPGGVGGFPVPPPTAPPHPPVPVVPSMVPPVEEQLPSPGLQYERP
jgi:hypothetical protein